MFYSDQIISSPAGKQKNVNYFCGTARAGRFLSREIMLVCGSKSCDIHGPEMIRNADKN